MMERQPVPRHPGITRRKWTAPDGRTVTKYDASYRAGGRELSRTFTRIGEAQRWLNAQREAVASRTWVDPSRGEIRLGAFFTQWEARARTVGKPAERTIHAYRQVWRQFVEPALGNRRLNSIGRADCQAVVDTAAKVSAWRATDTRKVLSSVLGSAVPDILARNPASDLTAPKVERKEIQVLDSEAFRRLVEALPERYQVLVLVAAYGALRWEEVVGLRASNVDFMNCRIYIEDTVTESGRLFHGKGKTEKSRRWVTLPASVGLSMAEHYRRFTSGSEYMFPGPDGGPLRRKTFARAWEKATKAAGVPGFQVRNLRHTGAVWMLEAKIHPTLVAFRMGHTTTRMIELHYGKLTESMDAEIAAQLEARAGYLRDIESQGTGARGSEGSESTA